MTPLFDVAGYMPGALYGDQLQVIESADGNHLQIFCVKLLLEYGISFIDFIYNPSLDPTAQYIEFETIDFSDYMNSANNGDVTINNYNDILLFMFSNFDTVFGFISCDYQSYYS